MVPFKRCRLSASPATGLVGMQESVFLGDFFRCMGFLPLTTQSNIRETMVKLMVAPATLEKQGAVYGFAGAGKFGTSAPERISTTVGIMDPSTCIFWCAIALGSLAKGSPIESVSRYCKMARDGLKNWSGPVDAELAKAWTSLGYLHLFCGNADIFLQYMALSESFLNISTEQGSTETLPLGFTEMVQHRWTVKVCTGNIDAGELGSFCAQQQAPPQLPGVLTEAGLYVWVMKATRMFEQAVYGAAYGQGILCADDNTDGDEPVDEGGRFNRRQMEVPTAFLDAMEGAIREKSFGRLEEAVDRPSIRGGIGGLLINSSLAFEKAVKGDRQGTLERIGRCVDVFERFPGLCRLTVGMHQAHVLVTILAAVGCYEAQDLYSTLRANYNYTRLPGSAPLPRFEEWHELHGISSCCDYFFCRTMQRIILRQRIPFSSTAPDAFGTKHGGIFETGVPAEPPAACETKPKPGNWDEVGDSAGNEDGTLGDGWLERTLLGSD